MRRVAVGAYLYLEFALCMGAFVPLMAVSQARHRDDVVPRAQGKWMRRLGRTAARLTTIWDFSVSGDPPADIAKSAYVVVSNHASNVDPFLLSFLPWDMRWVAKEEMFKPPLVGTLMRLSGDIPLRRGKGESVRAMMAECKRTLLEGLSVMIFPEGTRSRDERLLPFKLGAFELAIDAQVPVLPIAIDGTRACLPRGSRWPGPARGIATILEPIPTAGLGPQDAPALRDRVRARIAEALGAELNDDPRPPSKRSRQSDAPDARETSSDSV